MTSFEVGQIGAGVTSANPGATDLSFALPVQQKVLTIGAELPPGGPEAPPAPPTSPSGPSNSENLVSVDFGGLSVTACSPSSLAVPGFSERYLRYLLFLNSLLAIMLIRRRSQVYTGSQKELPQ